MVRVVRFKFNGPLLCSKPGLLRTGSDDRSNERKARDVVPEIRVIRVCFRRSLKTAKLRNQMPPTNLDRINAIRRWRSQVMVSDLQIGSGSCAQLATKLPSVLKRFSRDLFPFFLGLTLSKIDEKSPLNRIRVICLKSSRDKGAKRMLGIKRQSLRLERPWTLAPLTRLDLPAVVEMHFASLVNRPPKDNGTIPSRFNVGCA
jgi:hypothetical protein